MRGAKATPPSPRRDRPSDATRGEETEGEVDEAKSKGHLSREKAAPSISIEPDTSLELTEEMVHGGQSKVISRDTPLAKAYGSDTHKAEVCVRVHLQCIVLYWNNLCVCERVSV